MQLKGKNMDLRIGWLFPKLMSTYGDRGNVICLQKRAAWRGIQTEVVPIDSESSTATLSGIDVFLGGGAQDKEQEIARIFLREGMGEGILKPIEQGVPALFICGAMQVMGRSYQLASGSVVEGVGLFDCQTLQPGGKASRLTGHLVYEIAACALQHDLLCYLERVPLVLGFENHQGRTYLGKNGEPLGRVKRGYGNNAQDGLEGVFYKNAIGTYAHGPLLPKNPFLADWLIQKALQVKYGKKIELPPIEEAFSLSSRAALLKRFRFSQTY